MCVGMLPAIGSVDVDERILRVDPPPEVHTRPSREYEGMAGFRVFFSGLSDEALNTLYASTSEFSRSRFYGKFLDKTQDNPALRAIQAMLKELHQFSILYSERISPVAVNESFTSEDGQGMNIKQLEDARRQAIYSDPEMISLLDILHKVGMLDERAMRIPIGISQAADLISSKLDPKYSQAIGRHTQADPSHTSSRVGHMGSIENGDIQPEVLDTLYGELLTHIESLIGNLSLKRLTKLDATYEQFQDLSLEQKFVAYKTVFAYVGLLLSYKSVFRSHLVIADLRQHGGQFESLPLLHSALAITRRLPLIILADDINPFYRIDAKDLWPDYPKLHRLGKMSDVFNAAYLGLLWGKETSAVTLVVRDAESVVNAARLVLSMSWDDTGKMAQSVDPTKLTKALIDYGVNFVQRDDIARSFTPPSPFGCNKSK